ncbi:choice-of-anchor D domain-containing protein [Longispora albida]|uniref:choice-of-anchor D domain-containing protein n=1 Tax=Longispora albida TaxID=203523 RepID=UPI0003788AEE|nr:choice-of-anchor D domain-containing protein [Longispora albida]
MRKTVPTVAALAVLAGTLAWEPAHAALRIAADDVPAEPVVYLAEAEAAPVVALSPASHDFGTQDLGTTSAPQAFTISNTGDAPYNITSAALGGTNPGDFAKTSDTCTGKAIPAYGTCKVTVVFTPVMAGQRTATLTVTDAVNGKAEHIRVANLTGTGRATPAGGPAPAPAQQTAPPAPSGTPAAKAKAKTAELPVTGIALPVLLAIGALLVAAGAGLYRLARQR